MVTNLVSLPPRNATVNLDFTSRMVIWFEFISVCLLSLGTLRFIQQSEWYHVSQYIKYISEFSIMKFLPCVNNISRSLKFISRSDDSFLWFVLFSACGVASLAAFIVKLKFQVSFVFTMNLVDWNYKQWIQLLGFINSVGSIIDADAVATESLLANFFCNANGHLEKEEYDLVDCFSVLVGEYLVKQYHLHGFLVLLDFHQTDIAIITKKENKTGPEIEMVAIIEKKIVEEDSEQVAP